MAGSFTNNGYNYFYYDFHMDNHGLYTYNLVVTVFLLVANIFMLSTMCVFVCLHIAEGKIMIHVL